MPPVDAGWLVLAVGLDGVELAMEVEDRFGVKLPDAECSRVRTVADLAALVIRQLGLPRGGGATLPCVTARSFYGFRRQLARHGIGAGLRVRPGTRLGELMPGIPRRVWRKLRDENPRLPSLRVPGTVEGSMVILAGLSVFVAIVGGTLAGARWGALAGAGALAVGFVPCVALSYASVRAGWRWPEHVRTVGDVARELSSFEVGSGGGGTLIRNQKVLEEVRRITSEQLGIPLERVLPESDLIRDLGMG